MAKIKKINQIKNHWLISNFMQNFRKLCTSVPEINRDKRTHPPSNAGTHPRTRDIWKFAQTLFGDNKLHGHHLNQHSKLEFILSESIYILYVGVCRIVVLPDNPIPDIQKINSVYGTGYRISVFPDIRPLKFLIL